MGTGKPTGSRTLESIAREIGGTVEGDGGCQITGVASVEDAKSGQITFIADEKYLKFLDRTQASALIVPEKFDIKTDRNLIRTKNAVRSFSRVVEIFFPPTPAIEKGIHPTAVIEANVRLGEDVRIGAHVFIGENAVVGDRTVIMPGSVVEASVTIGSDVILSARACIKTRCVLGDRVIIHSGAVIGSDGFGFTVENGKYVKIPQVGIVVIEDDVEIGANTTVDRATLGVTRIGRGTKIDNLVQVAHNCTIGENTVIAGQAGLSGSTHVGSNVQIGGQAGFGGHTKVGDGAIVGAQAGVIKDVPEKAFVFGAPARPKGEEGRILASMARLPEMIKEMKALKEQVRKLLKERGKNADESEDTRKER